MIFAALMAVPALAEESRELDAHEHGVGSLNIAIDGQTIAMELRAPGADIVGFEYAATTSEDRAAIDNAVAILARPLDLFKLPEAAECSVTQASAELESEEEDHDDHDDHAEHDGQGDEESHDDHAEHDEDDEVGHTEFHAEYFLACAEPGAISQIAFDYFETFPNALELEVQILTAAGAKALEVTRDEPTVELGGLF